MFLECLGLGFLLFVFSPFSWLFRFENLVIFIFSLLFLISSLSLIYVTFKCISLSFLTTTILAWFLTAWISLRICGPFHIRLKLLSLAFKMSKIWLVFSSTLSSLLKQSTLFLLLPEFPWPHILTLFTHHLPLST